MLIVGPRGADLDALSAAVRGRGGTPVPVPVRPGVRGTLEAAGDARRRDAHALVTLDGAHPVARLLGRGRPRWTAHAGRAPELRAGRWGRLLDPRARLLRRADAVTAPAAVAGALHRTAGVAARPVAGVDELARLLAEPGRAATGRPRVLMLGTINTPHVEHLALALRDRGHEVVVAGDVAAAYAPSVLPAAGVDVRPVEYPRLPWLRRIARAVRPDVVHAHWLPDYAFLAAALRLRPLVAMAWGSDVYGATPWQRRRARFAVRSADVAMTDSADLVRRLVELGADPERTYELNWGVDLDRFSPAGDRAAIRHALGLGDGPLVLGPRALEPLYNPAIVAEAFERAAVPDAQLVLKHIGTGTPDIGRPLPAGARIAGHVPYEQLADWYRAADVCVSIPLSDSSPRSVWEAMACGCACVLSDLPWVHELIEDGRHALVVPADPDAVAAAIRRLLSDPGLAAHIGREARALAVAHRDQRAEMDRLSDLYGRLARSRP